MPFLNACPKRRTAALQFDAILVVPLFVAALSGCGNGLSHVSGQVTLDGQPLRGGGDVRATVKFQPASGTGPAAVALVDENGNYSLSTGSQVGVPPGDYVIVCSASQLVKTPGTNAPQGARRITDPKYDNPNTSGLKFTVQSGKNEFNIPLQSAPKTAAKPGA